MYRHVNFIFWLLSRYIHPCPLQPPSWSKQMLLCSLGVTAHTWSLCQSCLAPILSLQSTQNNLLQNFNCIISSLGWRTFKGFWVVLRNVKNYWGPVHDCDQPLHPLQHAGPRALTVLGSAFSNTSFGRPGRTLFYPNLFRFIFNRQVSSESALPCLGTFPWPSHSTPMKSDCPVIWSDHPQGPLAHSTYKGSNFELQLFDEWLSPSPEGKPHKGGAHVVEAHQPAPE